VKMKASRREPYRFFARRLATLFAGDAMLIDVLLSCRVKLTSPLIACGIDRANRKKWGDG
jgi:hypothetical protein